MYSAVRALERFKGPGGVRCLPRERLGFFFLKGSGVSGQRELQEEETQRIGCLSLVGQDNGLR